MGKVRLFRSEERANEVLPLNKPKRVVLEEKPYCIVRSSSGIHVVEYLCPHQHHPMHEGFVNDYDELICSLHQYRYHLVLGSEASNHTRDLRRFKVEKSEAGEIFVHLPD